MNDGKYLVLALDDEPAVLTSLGRLLTVRGHPVRLHADPEDLFRAGPPAVPACLLLDQQLGEGSTGVEVHAEMKRLGWDVPTIFLTAHWNVQLVVDAMRHGADGFLTKPYDPEELLREIAKALDRSRSLIRAGVKLADLRLRAESLTPRERSIVTLVIGGLLNKEIADRLKLAVVTIKVHRGRAMCKLGAGNPAELVKLATMAGIVEDE